MKSKNKKDLIEEVVFFKKNILSKKISVREMLKELSYMQFKIRPLHGDISRVNFANPQFVSSLWSLGKLEEFAFSKIKSLKSDEVEIFFKLMDEIRIGLEAKMGEAPIIKPFFKNSRKARFEIEIIKDMVKKIH